MCIHLGENVISDIRYGYDDKGDCIKKANVADGINTVTEYRYDGIGRITGVTGPDIRESYAYDRAGNRVSRMTDRGITESYRYNEVNELLSVERSNGDGEVNEVREFTYDADGNMTSDGRGIYKYDSMNRMAEAVMEDGRKLICRYDAEGLRHETEENGRLIKFIYSGRDAVCEEDEESVTRYIRGNGRLVASDSEQARTYYHYACDSLGSVSHVIAGDEFGSEEQNADIGRRVLCRYEYDAFGNTVSAKENVTNRYGFVGEMCDGITGQYYLRARYYVPEIGRFTQADTYHGDGLNLYVYARNNPVKYVDPSGHKSKGNDVESCRISNFRDLMSQQEAARYDSYWYEIGTQKAIIARDTTLNEISSWSNTKRNDIITVVGAVDLDNGNVAVGIKSQKMHRGIYLNGKYICAEDLAVQQLGGNKPSIVMTEAIRPRTMKPKSVCIHCQKIYSRNQFMEGVEFEE